MNYSRAKKLLYPIKNKHDISAVMYILYMYVQITVALNGNVTYVRPPERKIHSTYTVPTTANLSGCPA